MEVDATRSLTRRTILWLAGASCLALTSPARAAVPPTPAGPHPRLFMSAAESAAYATAAKVKGTAAASLVASCQSAIDKPTDVATRGGADGSNWPGTAVACAFAYRVTQTPAFLTAAIQYWNASLNDDQKIGDGLGCVAGVDTNWQAWMPGGAAPTPPILLTVTHDTGYPMRWYGPYIALAYDWLHDAPGVDEALRTHTRTCLGAWVDYYTKSGYHHDEAGANYNAGYVIGKALTAIAFGGENGAASDRVWSETVTDLFGGLLVGEGLAGAADPVGKPAGVLAGGDWGEGWQYGPLSVLEYAAAARAVESAGAPLPEMDAWASSLVVRYVHASVPKGDGVFNANGDLEADTIYPAANAGPLDAVLVGPSSDQAAAWAAFVKQDQKVKGGGIWNAIAEARAVTPADYRAQTPAPPLWYLARGTRTLFARTAWTADALWGVFASPPQVVSDHHHFSAGNVVFSRGADHLIVDPSNYGEPGTLETNAPTVDSPGITGSYAPSQTPWSQAELLWARGTTDAVFAARGDFAKGFMNNNGKSDIPYARRDWVMLPEGEMVLVDRAQTADAAHGLYVSLHANTAGALALQGATATGAVGASKVAIHGVVLGGAAPALSKPMVTDTYMYPCGKCTNARFAVDLYSVKVPGPWAVAVHVVDALAAADAPAVVDSMNDDAIDPAPKQNPGVVGASVFRGGKQSFVVAASAPGGVAGATLTYGVPGVSAGRHVVFDAPEQADGQSQVTAAAAGDRCVVTITAGAGVAGHPAMFSVSSAADGCKVSADTDVPPGMPPPGGGVSPIVTGAGGAATGAGGSATGAGGSATGAGGAATGAAGASSTGGGGAGGSHAQGGGTSGGCGCATSGARASTLAPLVMLALAFSRRRARAPRARKEAPP
jgi:MYXO-CTERM domain-containing protein